MDQELLEDIEYELHEFLGSSLPARFHVEHVRAKANGRVHVSLTVRRGPRSAAIELAQLELWRQELYAENE